MLKKQLSIYVQYIEGKQPNGQTISETQRVTYQQVGSESIPTEP